MQLWDSILILDKQLEGLAINVDDVYGFGIEDNYEKHFGT